MNAARISGLIPSSGGLTCDHCGNQSDIQTGPWGGAALKELDFDRAIANQLPSEEIEETRVSKCPNCAAEVEFDATIHARECPFCATPVVVDTGTHRHIKPRGLLPFAMEERQAHKAMTDWLGKLWFAPNGVAGLRPQGPQDGGHLRALLDL